MANDFVEFFNEDMAQNYDDRNKRIAPIKESLHFTLSLILKTLPNDAKILCVGAGTGEEIIYFAKHFPSWSFVALEPSKPMLDVCEKRLKEAEIIDRCTLLNCYLEDLSNNKKYDAVISLFVGHFISKNERVNYFTRMVSKLLPKGYLVNVEISFDLNSTNYPLMLEKWVEAQKVMGATAESLEKLPEQLEEMLTVLAPSIVETQIKKSGIDNPICFFKAF